MNMRLAIRGVIVALALSVAACGAGSSAPAHNEGSADEKAEGASKPKGCPDGSFMGNDDACIKECSTDADCTGGATCQDVRFVESDGTTGPLMGKGCN